MWAPDRRRAARRRPRIRQAGTTAVELALVAMIFFTAVFGTIEVARLMFVYNTLQEVTRRAAAAAANVYPTDAAAITALKQDAVFRRSSGELVLASPVSDAHVRLTYLAHDLSVIPYGAWAADAAKNRQLCMANPHAAHCIRFVQVQICDTDDAIACQPVRSTAVVPVVSMRVPLHRATTIVPVGAIGYVQGTVPCPCS
jgi:Flp pilus assembly protein TadG